VRGFILLIGLCTTAGCVNVKAWERAYLADPIMMETDAREHRAFDMHMHRALAQGLIGGSVAGGGCGCEQ